MLRVLPPTFNQVVADREELLRKVEGSSTFATASARCAFYRPKANLFCSKWRNSRVWRDSRVISSNQKSVYTQLTTTLIFFPRQVWTWVVKRATSVCNSFCSNIAKRVALFFACFTAALRRLRGSQWTAPRLRVIPFPWRLAPCRLGTSQMLHQISPNNRGTQRQFLKNICSEDDLRSRIFGTFVVKFLACLPLLGFSNI